MSNVLVHPACAVSPEAINTVERATGRIAVIVDGGRRISLISVKKAHNWCVRGKLSIGLDLARPGEDRTVVTPVHP